MHYPTAVKAQALALLMAGYSSFAIEKQMAIPASTIREWRQAHSSEIVANNSDERLMQSATEIAVRAQRLIIDTLDQMSPDPKHLVNFNIVAGTAIDKILNARRAPPQSINVDKAVIIIERQQ